MQLNTIYKICPKFTCLETTSSTQQYMAGVQINTHLIHEEWDFLSTEESKIIVLYYRFHSQCQTHTKLHMSHGVPLYSYAFEAQGYQLSKYSLQSALNA